MSRYSVPALDELVAWSAPALMPGEFTVLLATMVLKAMLHFAVLLPNMLQAMALPRTLVMLFGWPEAPMVKKPELWWPMVTWMPFVPRPPAPGAAPVTTLSWMSSGLADVATATDGPATTFPPIRRMPAPLGKFAMVLPLIDPPPICAALAP